MLKEHVERSGLRVVLDTGVRSIYGDTRVAGVRLMSGEDIACDTIILATGLRPRVELAIAAGLPVRSGIRVDDQLRTVDPDIHAVGECAEHRGVVYGLAWPGLEQAQTVAAVLAGEQRVYHGSSAGWTCRYRVCRSSAPAAWRRSGWATVTRNWPIRAAAPPNTARSS